MRRVFLSHFCICLACAGAGFFAWQRGVPQAIYAADASMMTSAIAGLFVVTAVWLGWQAWLVHDLPRYLRTISPRSADILGVLPSADFGHLAERLAVAMGLIGTVIGLYIQAKLSPGEVNFTALVTTGCGAVAYVLIAILTFNIEIAIERALP